ncbi:uncharacterized protein K444DRAFT_619758 [Hyaloscypha bicolor E]|uniref:N-acetyltransferase domain-containing protein n=1 Tax=Hyaloscypha bicolor E TaxID=1095630 RepID=A0A2J6SQP6_9HELO|nr:uncharacterized protein K444DRAFT_619758 [Hyaloscypha bicolor E]PMD53092.1 hypothetical protein K444DRAFT_619758 [Hyaloscypha bicolor E]
MSAMASDTFLQRVSIRPAHKSDLTAIVALLLTSFRQFPLFDFLYSPLNRNFDVAHDTVFFWRRRLLLDLLDPEASVIVAEAPLNSLVSVLGGEPDDQNDPIYQKSVAALDWTERNGLPARSTLSQDNCIVGFAIWRFRKGGNSDSQPMKARHSPSCCNSLKASMTNFEVSFWKRVYQRKDQEPTRFAAYLAAEEELSKTHYQESCYYLDNLCVDFRYHRLGIGTLLLKWGLEVAQKHKLWVGTEAAPKGLGLYLKHGFKQVGWFIVVVHDVEHRAPVLRLSDYSLA